MIIGSSWGTFMLIMLLFRPFEGDLRWGDFGEYIRVFRLNDGFGLSRKTVEYHLYCESCCEHGSGLLSYSVALTYGSSTDLLCYRILKPGEERRSGNIGDATYRRKKSLVLNMLSLPMLMLKGKVILTLLDSFELGFVSPFVFSWVKSLLFGELWLFSIIFRYLIALRCVWILRLNYSLFNGLSSTD